MAENFIGAWQFVSAENEDAFHAAIGLTPEQATAIKGMRPTYTISRDGDDWSFKIEAPAYQQGASFKLGVPFVLPHPMFKDAQGSPLEVTHLITYEDGRWTETQTTAGRQVKVSSTTDGSTANMSMEAGGVTATAVYKKA